MPFSCTRIAVAILLISLLAGAAEAQVKPEPEGLALPDYARIIHLERTAVQTGLNEMTRNGLPSIMLTGYWPPTNEMIRRFSPDAVQNPLGWIGENWERRGYNIFAFFPEFPSGLGKGEGDFEVDYQDTSDDFWLIVDQIKPRAIITFGRAYPDLGWEVEWRHRNLEEPQWYLDYEAPKWPTPAPPDGSVDAGFIRYAALPMQAIADAVNASPIDVEAFVDDMEDSGGFLCEFIGYHASWYHDLHCDFSNPDPCIASGHIHVGSEIVLLDAVEAVKITVRTLIQYLDAPLVSDTQIIRQNPGGSVSFSLDAGMDHANRSYLLLGGATGTSPGTPLPGGVILPVNWDAFTDLEMALLGTPVFTGFMGKLDAAGCAQAVMDTLGPIPGAAGIRLHFAYALSPLPWYASNASEVRIVP